MRKRLIAGILIVLFLLTACGKGTKDKAMEPADETAYPLVTAHYGFIAETLEDRQWRQLYDRTKEAGRSAGAYVEALNDDFPDDYTKEDLLRAAIAMRLDGIFLEGDSAEATALLIDEALEAGIPVITLMSDAEGSRRISHIESGNYNLGRAYGRQIIEAAKEEGRTGGQDVLVILDDEEKRGRNVVLSAMIAEGAEDPLDITLNVTTETVGVGVFNSAQAVRRHILSVDRVPDFVISFTEQDTVNAYQVLVDYNRIGDVTLIGSSTAETILNAVKRGAVQSVVLTDTEQMAEEALEAMTTYRETGHVSDYFAAETIVLDKAALEEETDEIP